MKILITGGVGFIGTNCGLFFKNKLKCDITIVDNFSREGVEKNAEFLKQQIPAIDIIKADINDTDKYLNSLKKADVIIHLAGQTAVTTSIKNPREDFRTNVEGGFALLEAVRAHNPHAILLYSSTNKVYGDLQNHKVGKDEKNTRYDDICHPEGISEDQQLDFISPYGCSKGTIDQYMQDYSHTYGLRTVVFRQSCIYGPHQIGVEDQGWLAHFTTQFLHNKSLSIFGDGYQVRDLLYIEDLLEAYLLAIEHIDKMKGQAFNIGGGVSNSFSLLQVIKILEERTGSEIPVSFHDERLGDQKYFISSNKKLKERLSWEPKTKFLSGLDELLKWQKDFYSL